MTKIIVFTLIQIQFSILIPLIEKRFPGEKLSEVMMTQRILEIISEVQDYINIGYDYSVKDFVM